MADEKKIYNKLISGGLTPAGACGLMGNLQHESGLEPAICEWLCLQRLKEHGREYTQEQYTRAVNSGEISRAEFINPLPGKAYGYGLAQWTSTGRKGALYDYMMQASGGIGDLDRQISFLLKELSESFKSVFSVLKKTKSVKESSDIVLTKYEMPADADAQKDTRAATAQQFYDRLAGGKKGMISNSGGDERGMISGGQAGDQTGNEWRLREWYSRPWDCVLRYKKDDRVPALLGTLSIRAAKNDKIGYDQAQRDTYSAQLLKAGNDPAKITTACEADCSSGVIANTKAVGRLLGIDAIANIGATYTGNMRSAFRKAGFSVLTAKKYLTGDKYLVYGDILLNDTKHTAVFVGDGQEKEMPKAQAEQEMDDDIAPNKTPQYAVAPITALNVRTWAGTEHPNIKSIPVLAKGRVVSVCDVEKDVEGSDWLYVLINDPAKGKIYGFVSAKYVRKV